MGLTIHYQGEFWETEDRQALIAKMEFLQTKIDQIAEGLQSADFQGSPRSLDDIVAHIEKIVRGRENLCFRSTSRRPRMDRCWP